MFITSDTTDQLDKRFMAMAVALSQESVSSGGGPFGAIVVRDGEIISRGMNRVAVDNDPTAHAEVVAIRAACATLGTFDLSGCVIYTSCEPCPMCLSAIYWAGISHIFFANTKDDAAAAGFNDAFLYAEIAKPYTQRAIPLTHIADHDAIQVFRSWVANVDKTPY